MDTGLAIASLSGIPVVLWDVSTERPQTAFETEREQSAERIPTRFEVLANARTLDELLYGLEEFPGDPLRAKPVSRANIAQELDRANEGEVVRALGLSATPATSRKVKDALDAWSYQEASECTTIGGTQILRPVALASLSAMAYDLKAVCSMFAFSIGECRCEMLSKNLSEGLYFVRVLRSKKKAGGPSEYLEYVTRLFAGHAERLDLAKVLANSIGNQVGLMSSGDSLSSDERNKLVRDCQVLSTLAFNHFMQDSHPVITPDGKFSPHGNDRLGSAYAFFAEQLCAGKASICDYCGNLFLRRRSTKHVCSNSCKTSKSKAGVRHDD